jgi:hypothetical protein
LWCWRSSGAAPSDGGGGGGAGGYRTSCSFSVCGATAYPITVGAGGATHQLQEQEIMELHQYFQQLHQQVVEVEVVLNSNVGRTGGSGGGGGGGVPAPISPGPNAGGTGNTPPVSPPQGNSGGSSQFVDQVLMQLEEVVVEQVLQVEMLGL